MTVMGVLHSMGEASVRPCGRAAGLGIQNAGEAVRSDSLRPWRVGTLLQPRMKRVEEVGKRG
jgi:hypothetical protein